MPGSLTALRSWCAVCASAVCSSVAWVTCGQAQSAACLHQAIASDLGISVKTVECHRARVMERHGCSGLFELGRAWEAVVLSSGHKVPRYRPRYECAGSAPLVTVTVRHRGSAGPSCRHSPAWRRRGTGTAAGRGGRC
ncbi:hypothetical protein GBZ48_17930 [Azospirillum melinis]|uniref:HTH luxR-type domain-containing protein n=1 Tax=Azospirillum melinis TaxID=328839 RepID=A0ABX2KMU3_9PROT|nr:LuxR C-terminal-related transcriptional regulator [Azospirillum melinis]NUB01149.1 hypothetical protein [Azospirillum melinis]